MRGKGGKKEYLPIRQEKVSIKGIEGFWSFAKERCDEASRNLTKEIPLLSRRWSGDTTIEAKIYTRYW
jgi:hypothetical protein